MNISSFLFEAYLKCPTKCFLRSLGETGTGNAYADWLRERSESYRNDGIKRLTDQYPNSECIAEPLEAADLKAAEWKLAVGLVARGPNLESTIHAVERIPSEGRGHAAQFIPIRFVPTNKLTQDDKLLVAFDALVLSEVLGREVGLGKIIHGDDHAILTVKTSALAAAARKRLGEITALLPNSAPPDLVLSRHCAECEFRDRCRPKAVEGDSLSLLSGMSEKDYRKQHAKGIFSVTQLAYTFRPRRRPRRFVSKPERYHDELKALAIKDKRIYVVGKPKLQIAGTPVYVDVEGIPDRNFYYLIGMLVKKGGSHFHRSFWANDAHDEQTIWAEFTRALSEIENPILIHYGGYETKCFKRMHKRYGEQNGKIPGTVWPKYEAINLLSVIYAQIYFPTYSNGLKDLAHHLGFKWSDPNASGLQSILWRYEWESSRNADISEKLITYNTEDCRALELVAETVSKLCRPINSPDSDASSSTDVVNVESLKPDLPYRWGKPGFSLPELEHINKAAYWEYQQDRVYARLGKRPKRVNKLSHASLKMSKVIVRPVPTHCPNCGRKASGRQRVKTKIIYDISFSRFGLKRWVVKYVWRTYWCWKCEFTFGSEKRFRTRLKYGWNLLSYFIYQMIELHIPQRIVIQSLNRLFGFDLKPTGGNSLKGRAEEYYEATQQSILKNIVTGNLLHVDETKAVIRGKAVYVWVFTNLQEVAYVYAESREGDMLQASLQDFKGVLVSDFYAVYDSIVCPQQKCLIHLMRDLNDDGLKHPFNVELEQLLKDFALLLRPMIETIDRYGLKKHYLRKHLVFVKRFYKQLSKANYQSEIAIKYQKRFDKNRDKLFTFLSYDGVPWNNNNAEHAIKAFAALRNVMKGTSSEDGLKEYLILLSVCETCKNKGIDFLDFLRSGEKDIDAFAACQPKRRGRSPLPQGPIDSSCTTEIKNGL